MKKNLLGVLLIAGIWAVPAAAQTNAGFETWAVNPTLQQPEEPTTWITANTFASPVLTFPNPNPNPTSAFKAPTPDNYAGTYSLRLVTVNLAYNPDTSSIPNTLGFAFQGSIVTTPSISLKDRIPFTGRPSNISFAAKYTPSGIDTAWCYIELTKWNGSSRDIIGDMSIPIPASTSYQNFGVPIFYYPAFMNMFPDSMHLSFSSSSLYAPQPGSTLWADQVALTGWTGVQDVSGMQTLVSAFPNPASESISITAETENAASVIIYDGIGRTAGVYPMNDKKALIPVSSFKLGNYFYSVTDKNGQVMAGGTFTVGH